MDEYTLFLMLQSIYDESKKLSSDMSVILPEHFRLQSEDFNKNIEQLHKKGYIDGVEIFYADNIPYEIDLSELCVTTKGIHFIESNPHLPTLKHINELEKLIEEGTNKIQHKRHNGMLAKIKPEIGAALSGWKLRSIDKLKSLDHDVISDIVLEIQSNINSEDMILEGLKIALSRIENNAKVGSIKMKINVKKTKSNKVFIIHGHDEAAKESTARHLEKLGLEAIILHELANKGRTVIEKFEDASSDIVHAIALLTPDDSVFSKQYSENPIQRARQNVIFELGFFVGVLGRKNVTVLYKKGVEIPSDYSGVIYIEMDDYGAWKTQLAKELRESGLSIDLSALL